MKINNYLCDPDDPNQEIATTSELLRCAAGLLSHDEAIELEERIQISPYLEAKLEKLRRFPDIAKVILGVPLQKSRLIPAGRWFTQLRGLPEAIFAQIEAEIALIEAWRGQIAPALGSGFASDNFASHHPPTTCGEFAIIRTDQADGSVALRIESRDKERAGLTCRLVLEASSSKEVVWQGTEEIILEWNPNTGLLMGSGEIPASALAPTHDHPDAAISIRFIRAAEELPASPRADA